MGVKGTDGASPHLLKTSLRIGALSGQQEEEVEMDVPYALSSADAEGSESTVPQAACPIEGVVWC